MLVLFSLEKLSAWWRAFKCKHNRHDWPDGTGPESALPMHFHTYKCRHCKKDFSI